MENKRILFRVIGLVPVLFGASDLLAENALNGSFYALAGESDNAFKSEVDPVDERQDEYGLNLDGTYANSLIDSNLTYLVKEQRFTEGSQENKSTLDGTSLLSIGKKHHPFDVLFSHSRVSLLKEPEQITLTDNLDAREIFSVAPSVRSRLTSSDTLQLTASYTDIQFLETDQLDSLRQGASVAWIRRSSAVQQMQLAVQAMDIEFDSFIESNYTYRKAMFGYVAGLRKTRYSIEFGYNQSDPVNGETYTSPAYRAVLGYKFGLQEIELTSGQIITDSSFGNGNSSSVNELPGADGSFGNASRLERRDTQVQWTTSGICIKCTLSFSVFLQNDEYLEMEKESRQWGGNLRFGYRFSDATILTLSYSKSEQNSEGDDVAHDFDLNLLSAEYSYKFINDLSIRFRVEDETRYSEISMDEYRERYIGVGIGYQF